MPDNPPIYLPQNPLLQAHVYLLFATLGMVVCLAPSCLCQRHASLGNCKCIQEKDQPDLFFRFLITDCSCVLVLTSATVLMAIFLIAHGEHRAYGLHTLGGAGGLLAVLIALSFAKMAITQRRRRKQARLHPENPPPLAEAADEPVVGQPVGVDVVAGVHIGRERARLTNEAFQLGERVVIVGLSSRPELNTVVGDITAQPNERGRYTVQVVDLLGRSEQVAIKADNLRPAPSAGGSAMPPPLAGSRLQF